MMKQLHPSQCPNRQGSIAILAALFLVITFAFVAFSIDFGYIVVTKSELQNAADAGALSGARKLSKGRQEAITAAQLWASRNKAAGQSVETVVTQDIEIGRWDDATASFIVIPETSNEVPTAVRVTCRRTMSRGNALNLFFGSILGTSNADVLAVSIAAVTRNRCGYLIGLNYINVGNGQVDSYDSALGTYLQQPRRRNGNVCSDGPITIGSLGFVYGNAAVGRGFTVNAPAQVSGQIITRSTPIKWKPVNTTGISSNLNSTIPTKYFRNGELRITSDDVVILQPGTYHFPNGIKITGSGGIQTTGRTRIVMGGASSIGGKGLVNGTQVPGFLRIDITDGTTKFSGSSDFFADIYGPTADIAISGNAEFYGAVFARALDLSGSNSRIHGDESLNRDEDETTRSLLRL
jgi:Flp pilus assembly protein TadG